MVMKVNFFNEKEEGEWQLDVVQYHFYSAY